MKNYPFYVKNTIVLFGLTLIVYALYTLSDIMIPLAFALLLAILLNPMTNWFKRKKIKHGLAITLSVIIAIIGIAAVIYFLSTQIARFGEELPAMKKKFAELFVRFQASVQSDLGMPVAKQDQLIAEAKTGLKPLLGHTLGTVLGSLSIIFLLPVYTFLFLYYKTLILNFLFEIFSEKNSMEVNDVLHETKGAIQNYMYGLLLEALIVAALNFLLLWMLGVKYALLLGVLGALLNI
ncbi:MAG: AI-2E family transporter, partial [Ferruginibacter sp.]